MLELHYLFVGDVTGCCEVEVAVSPLVAFLIQFRDPPAANKDDGMLCELLDLGTSRQDDECWR
jgi:hypothetical protein